MLVVGQVVTDPVNPPDPVPSRARVASDVPSNQTPGEAVYPGDTVGAQTVKYLGKMISVKYTYTRKSLYSVNTLYSANHESEFVAVVVSHRIWLTLNKVSLY